jgi:PKHD-type hydroxylase
MDVNVAPQAMPFVALPNAFSAAELDEIERIGDAHAVEKATLLGVPQQAQYDVIRVTETAWLVPKEELRWLYDKMTAIVRAFNEQFFHFELIGFSDPFQYTIYRAGAHYDWHADHGAKTVNPRKLSLSLQLSDAGAYQGCDLQTRIGNAPCDAPRERGTVIAFPSYVLHRVTPITAGMRKSLVAWVVGPPFR